MTKITHTIVLGAILVAFLSACAGSATSPPAPDTTITLTQPTETATAAPQVSTSSPSGGEAAPAPNQAKSPTDEPAAALEPIWETRAHLPEANSELSVAELDGKIYALGGYPASRQTADTVQIYDAASDSWRIGPPLPVASNHNVAAALDGKVYIIGGQPTAQGGGPFLQEVYAYDPATDNWSERAPMPTWRGGMGAAVLDGKIYVAGGRPPFGHEFAVYDPQTDQWTRLPEMPTSRNHFVVAAVNGEIYAVGGRFGAGFSSEVTDIVEIYNPDRGEWRTGAPMPTPRSGHNGIVAYGCLHVMGGEGNGPGNVSGLYPQHEVYDPNSTTWTTLDPMPVPVHGVTGMAFIDGWIHFPGGGTSQGGSSGSTLHQVYRPAPECS